MCSITELGFVRVLEQAPPVWCLIVFHLRSWLLRPSTEAPPPDLRYAGSSQTYLEPGFAETATVPVALGICLYAGLSQTVVREDERGDCHDRSDFLSLFHPRLKLRECIVYGGSHVYVTRQR
jgi:hypothetical protein